MCFQRLPLQVAFVLALGMSIMPGVILPAVAESRHSLVAQAKPRNEIDQAIDEGTRLFQEGSAKSLRKSIQQFEKALDLMGSAKAEDKQALALLFLGKLHSNLGEKRKALDYYNQALLIMRAIEDRSGEATTLNNIGSVHNALGEKQKALNYYNQALPLYRTVGDRSGEAAALNNIGGIYDVLGEKQKALDYYNQALSLIRSVGDHRGEATTLNNIGIVYSALGEKQKALDYYNQALPLRRAMGDLSGEATTLNNIGRIYSALRENQKALDYYNQALPLRRAVGDLSGEATTLSSIGSVYSALGENQKALDYHNQVLLIYRAVSNRSGEAATLNNIGSMYLALGENQKALNYYNQALPLIRAVGDRAGEAITLNNIGYLLNNQKQPELTIVFYKQSVNLYESLRKDISQLPRETQETYTKYVSDTYRALANALLAQGRIGEAQKVLELLKIQEINDSTEGTRSASPLPQVNLNDIEKEIIDKYTSLVEFGKQFYDCEQTKCSRFSEYDTQYRKLTAAYNQFIKDIRAKLIEARDKEIDAGTKQFIDKAESIVTAQPNTVLIYPLVLQDKVRILWATQGGALDQTECPIGEADLSKLVEQFRNALQTSDDLNPVQQTGKQLYNCLIPPKLQKVITQNNIDNLIFVPDRITNYIPMAALHDGQQYLIEKYSVSNILAASFTDTESRLPKNPDILGFGLSQAVTLTNPTRPFSELPYVPLELDDIIKRRDQPNDPRGIFSGIQWLDREFTRDRLTRALLDQPNILHIATHGEFNPTDPRTSYLVLGDGTPYPTSEIQYLRNLKNVHLVVLSACETALGGRDRNGLEIAGIASYFLGDQSNAKAKAVLASLWKVNDPATTVLMSDFYTTLNRSNQSKAKALQQVQRQMINSKLTLKDAADRAGARRYEPNKKRPKNLSHPYYWAPFILIGNSL